jgi:hypothetical protein
MSLAPPALRIGFVGSGFIARFHLKSFLSVRHAQITGVFSPTAEKRRALAEAANAAELGPCRAHDDLEGLITANDVDALWILAPNDTRLEVMRAMNAAVKAGRSQIRVVACEKPLGRTLAEAREVLALASADAGGRPSLRPGGRNADVQPAGRGAPAGGRHARQALRLLRRDGRWRLGHAGRALHHRRGLRAVHVVAPAHAGRSNQPLGPDIA